MLVSEQNSPMISESRWRSLPWPSKLSVGLALGTWETAIASAAMTFFDSYVPLEQWSCQPREEAQQCRRPNFTEAKSPWQYYHLEERKMTKRHHYNSQIFSLHSPISFLPTQPKPEKWMDGLGTSHQCIIIGRCKYKIDINRAMSNILS